MVKENQNIFKNYKEMYLINSYKNAPIVGTLDGQFQIALITSSASISNDYGATFSDWTYNSGVKFNDLKFSQDKKYWIGKSNSFTMISSDYGVTFSNINEAQTVISIDVNGNGQYMTKVMVNGIWVSSDYGANFTQQYSTARNFKRLIISESGQYQTVWTQSYNPLVSNDYGITWTPKANSRTWLYGDMSLSGQYQVGVGYGFSAYVSNDYGQTWVAKDTAFQDYNCSMSGDGKYILKGGTGSMRMSSDYGATWSIVVGAGALWLYSDMSGDGKYMLAINGSSQAHQSTDYGVTWNAITSIGVSCSINRIL